MQVTKISFTPGVFKGIEGSTLSMQQQAGAVMDAVSAWVGTLPAWSGVIYSMWAEGPPALILLSPRKVTQSDRDTLLMLLGLELAVRGAPAVPLKDHSSCRVGEEKLVISVGEYPSAF
jgi:hypothetical protein